MSPGACRSREQTSASLLKLRSARCPFPAWNLSPGTSRPQALCVSVRLGGATWVRGYAEQQDMALSAPSSSRWRNARNQLLDQWASLPLLHFWLVHRCHSRLMCSHTCTVEARVKLSKADCSHGHSPRRGLTSLPVIKPQLTANNPKIRGLYGHIPSVLTDSAGKFIL